MSMGHRLAICGAMALGLAAAPVAADTLHAFCAYTAPSCMDDGTITPEYVTNQPDFGFNSSGNKGTYGEFLLAILIPDNVKDTIKDSFSLVGTNTADGTVGSTLYSKTPWTSGNLTDYLSISADPKNPLDAWLPSTQTWQPSATGYYVFTLDFGSVTFGSSTDPSFALSSSSSKFQFPGGTVVAAFADGSKGWISTAQSAALLVARTATVVVPEPDSLALVGGAFIGVVGLWLLRRQRSSGGAI